MDEAAIDQNSKPKESFPQQVAKYSALAPVCIPFLIVVSSITKMPEIVLGTMNALLIVTGLLAAIFALCCIPRNGTKGILGFALTGLVVNGLLVLMMVNAFF